MLHMKSDNFTKYFFQYNSSEFYKIAPECRCQMTHYTNPQYGTKYVKWTIAEVHRCKMASYI